MSDIPNRAKRNWKTESRKRQKVLRFRVSETEANQIRKIAGEMGIPVGEYLRCSALDQEIVPPEQPLPSPDRKVLAQLLGLLGKFGSNINQIARSANRGQKVEFPEEILSALPVLGVLAKRLARKLR